MIEAKDIKLFLDRWGQGVVAIGKLNNQPEIQMETARKFIRDFYGYDDFPVLFTPTKAAELQFRNTQEGALSYFVAGNENFPEDHGFAKEPWAKVRFEFSGINIVNEVGLAMGNYFFVNAVGEETKAEFSFAIKENDEQQLKIILHHSSLPFGH